MAVSPGGFVALDCADPQRLARFWADMLGGQLIAVNPDVVAIRTDWIWLTALRVPDYVPPTWPEDRVPKQIHFDLAVTDLTAAIAAAEALGACLPDYQPQPDRWRVLLDPAGHPFCLTTQIPLDVVSPGPPVDARQWEQARDSVGGTSSR
jgi:hypothetical protein